jgi:hypothetical protein
LEYHKAGRYSVGICPLGELIRNEMLRNMVKCYHTHLHWTSASAVFFRPRDIMARDRVKGTSVSVKASVSGRTVNVIKALCLQ